LVNSGTLVREALQDLGAELGIVFHDQQTLGHALIVTRIGTASPAIGGARSTMTGP
jgi:excinuclease UvrABC ATPase subunit